MPHLWCNTIENCVKPPIPIRWKLGFECVGELKTFGFVQHLNSNSNFVTSLWENSFKCFVWTLYHISYSFVFVLGRIMWQMALVEQGVLNAVAPQTATNADFTAALARAMWRPALFPMPSAVLKLIYGSERASVITDGQKVVPKRTLESGYQFLYPDLLSACRNCTKMFLLPEWLTELRP